MTQAITCACVLQVDGRKLDFLAVPYSFGAAGSDSDETAETPAVCRKPGLG